MKNRIVKCVIAPLVFLFVVFFFACKKENKPLASTPDSGRSQESAVSEQQPDFDKAPENAAAGTVAAENGAAVTAARGSAAGETPENTAATPGETASREEQPPKPEQSGVQSTPSAQTEQSVPPTTAAAPPAQHPSVPAGFVRINGGVFTMGSPSSEQGRTSEESPQFQVTVSAFYMARHPVTQTEYERVRGENPSGFRGAQLPVEQVDWFDAIEYCNKRSLMEGLRPAYTVDDDTGSVSWNREANGYRLPTEVEWEYACRAGTTTPFSTGNEITSAQANFDGTNPYNSNMKGENRQRTTTVGSFQPNPWGLYDMHGNVFEWCWDWYGRYASGGMQYDPAGPARGTSRVYRGGSWKSNMLQLRSAYRYNAPPSGSGDSTIGFRVARGL